MTTNPPASELGRAYAGIDEAGRLGLARLLLEALEADESEAGRRFAAEMGRLRDLATEALAPVVSRPVAMPFLTGLDVGDRIVYRNPAPYRHVLEYVAAGAQRFSWEDARGPYEAELAAPPDERVTSYLEEVRAFTQAWRLRASWSQRLIVHAHVHLAHGGEDARREALDALTGGRPAARRWQDAARATASWLLSPESGRSPETSVVEFAEAARLRLEP